MYKLYSRHFSLIFFKFILNIDFQLYCYLKVLSRQIYLKNLLVFSVKAN